MLTNTPLEEAGARLVGISFLWHDTTLVDVVVVVLSFGLGGSRRRVLLSFDVYRHT